MTYFAGGMGDEPSDKPSAAQSAADLAAARPQTPAEAAAAAAADPNAPALQEGCFWTLYRPATADRSIEFAMTCPPPAPANFLGALFGGIAQTGKDLVTGVSRSVLPTGQQVVVKSGGNTKFIVLGGLAIVGAVLLFRKAAPAMNPRRRRRRR